MYDGARAAGNGRNGATRPNAAPPGNTMGDIGFSASTSSYPNRIVVLRTG